MGKCWACEYEVGKRGYCTSVCTYTYEVEARKGTYLIFGHQGEGEGEGGKDE